nr:MAG TPA: hypothetical protein [Caudoviricetes sp.]
MPEKQRKNGYSNKDKKLKMCLLRIFCCYGKTFQNFFGMNFQNAEFLTPENVRGVSAHSNKRPLNPYRSVR